MFTDPIISTVTIFAGQTAPPNWMFCQGQLLYIDEYINLYSIIGTIYGGDGQSTFALPDFRGRVAVGPGHPLGMNEYFVGTEGGNEAVLLTPQQIPHTHAVSNAILNAPPASTSPGTTDIPTGNVPAVVAGAPAAYTTGGTDINLGVTNSFSNSGSTGSTNPVPLPVISPYLAMNYIICYDGNFPPELKQNHSTNNQ